MKTHNLYQLKKKSSPNSGLKQLVLIVAIIEPLMTIPQIYKIWSAHTAEGVSLLSWSFYVIAASIWLLYGLRAKDRAIIVSSALWVLTEGAVVLGVLLYH